MGRPHHATLGRDELRTLRRAAAMAHTIGAISLRLSAGGTTIVDVVPPDAPIDRWRAEPAPGARIDPCGFRIAVGRAWEDHCAGRHVGLVGLRDDAAEPPLTVTWTVGSPGTLIGFGGVRAMCATRMVWAFASVLRPETLAELLTGFAANGGPDPALGDDLAAKLIHDDVLAATVVHVEASCLGQRDPPTSSTVRLLDEVLRRMLAAVGAAEVVDELNCRQL
jgi:hypothetical protein